MLQTGAQALVGCTSGQTCSNAVSTAYVVDHLNYIFSAPANACSFPLTNIQNIPFNNGTYSVSKLPTTLNVTYYTCKTTTTTVTIRMAQNQWGICVGCCGGCGTPEAVALPYCQVMEANGVEVSRVNYPSNLVALNDARNTTHSQQVALACGACSVVSVVDTNYAPTLLGSCGAFPVPGRIEYDLVVTCQCP